MNDKMLYRVAEAAVRLSLSKSKVYELIKNGALQSVQIDSSRRIKAEDLQAYVDSLGVAA